MTFFATSLLQARASVSFHGSAENYRCACAGATAGKLASFFNIPLQHNVRVGSTAKTSACMIYPGTEIEEV